MSLFQRSNGHCYAHQTYGCGACLDQERAAYRAQAQATLEEQKLQVLVRIAVALERIASNTNKL